MEWIDHSWLSDAILYISGSQSSLFTALFILLPTFFLSLYILKVILDGLNIERVVKTLGLTLAIPLSSLFWKLHPFIFIIPLLLVSILAYLKYWQENSKTILWIIPIFFLWANLSGGSIFIIVSFFILAFLLLTIVQRIKFLIQPQLYASNKRVGLLLASIFLAVSLTFLNPSGVKIWTYSGKSIELLLGPTKSYSSLAGAILAANSTYVKEILSSYHFTLFLGYVLFMILGLAFFIVRDKLQFIRNIFPYFILIIFLIPGFVWIRLIHLSIFGSLPIFVFLVNYLLSKISNSAFKTKVFSLGGYLIAFAIPSIFFLNPPTQITVSEPKAQLDFIRENGLPPNILTTPDLTGFTYYYLYPQRAGIDTLDDLFDEHETINIYSIVALLPEEFIKDISQTLGVSTILASKDADYLTLELSQNEDWALVYIDYNGFVFVKKDAVSQEFLNSNYLSEINLGRNLGFNIENIDKATEQLKRFTANNPESTLALGQLASLYRFQQKFDEAEKTLQKIPKNKRDFIFMTEMGRIKAAQGLCKSSEDWYLQALKLRKEQNLSRAVLDLAVLYAGCFQDKEKARHFFQRYNSYPISPGEREKARKIAKDFGISLEEADTDN